MSQRVERVLAVQAALASVPRTTYARYGGACTQEQVEEGILNSRSASAT